MRRWALVPNGLEPNGLLDGAWLAPCAAVATVLIIKRGRICAGDNLSVILSLYTLCGTVAVTVSYGVVLV